MILDLRFLAGVAVGTTLGFLINPEAAEKAGIDIQSIKRTMPVIGSSPAEPVKQADWPTNEHAKRELFRFAMWDFETFGPKSEILMPIWGRNKSSSKSCAKVERSGNGPLGASRIEHQ